MHSIPYHNYTTIALTLQPLRWVQSIKQVVLRLLDRLEVLPIDLFLVVWQGEILDLVVGGSPSLQLHNMIVSVENGSNLLEGERSVGSLGLLDGEPEVYKLETEPDGVDNVEFPSDGVEGDGVDVLVEDQRGVDTHLHHHQSLGSDSEGENLDRVGDQERGHGDIVESVVDEDGTEDGLTGGIVGVGGEVGVNGISVGVEVEEILGVD